MAVRKEKVIKIHPFERVEEWSVKKHGVKIHINKKAEFKDGISLDIEHDGNGAFVGIGVSDGSDCWYYSSLDLVRQIEIPKFIAHNGISDLRHLQAWGFDVDESHLVYDTMLVEHILDSSKKQYGLKDICKRLGLGEWPDYKEIVGKDKTLLDFPVEDVAAYNAADCYFTWKLYQNQLARLY